MADLAEILAGLEQGVERLSKAVDSYLPILESKRKAQAEAQAKALKKAKDLELQKELAVRVDNVYRQMKKMGLLDEVKTH